MLALFSVTLFISSALLFWVQPMFAKMVLPMLGGTPAVWNTCMLFFQSALLAGYLYAHATTAWFGVRWQATMHIGLLLLALASLPVGVPRGWSPPVEGNPIAWLFGLLIVALGLPFFLLAASAPMLQRWFSHTGHPDAKDPYFLYAASNLGSMVALVSYPALLEPTLRLAEQSLLWAGGYGLLGVLTVACAVVLRRSLPTEASPSSALMDLQPQSSGAEDARSPTAGRRMRWVALSFVPSSLMLGVTTYISTDIAAVPLLWVIPLVIYLLTFVLVFARKPVASHAFLVRRLPFLILASAVTIFFDFTQSVWLLVLLHLLMLFVAAMVCHGELVKERPPPRDLTEFYLWMSVGGVLGGSFNALLAPMVFNTVVEYPLAMILAALLQPRTSADEEKASSCWLDFTLPLALGVITAGLVLGLRASGLVAGELPELLIFGLSMVVCLSFGYRPIRFGLGVGVIMLPSILYTGSYGRVLYTERSFFGVHRIMLDREGKYRLLFHGSTIHGAQSLDSARRSEPLTYFYRTGPIGQVFAAFRGEVTKRQVAIIGLGAGSMLCYAESGQPFTFYEIDPTVERIARETRHFTFLRDCPAQFDVVLGDARLSLVGAPNNHYGLIILDAYSSDAMPIHLLTREAMKLYLNKLADGGILAFHISNRYLDLRPVVADLGLDLGLVSLIQEDLKISEADIKRGKVGSIWVVMAGQRAALGKLAQDPRWKLLQGRPGAAVWSDDFSNILSVFRWRWSVQG